MTDRHQSGISHGGAIVLCVLLSLLLHALTVALLLQLPPREPQSVVRAHPRYSRSLQVIRQKAEPGPAPEQEKKEKPFAKTSADTAQQTPEQADFVGARNTRASSDPTARDLRSKDKAPAVHGKERQQDEEIVTFDQERQEGDLAAEGKKDTQATPAAGASEGEAPTEIPVPAASPSRIPAALTTLPLPTDLFGEQPLTKQRDDSFPADKDEFPRPQQRARRRYYDPALSAEAQKPGFRTNERKTRSSGRFIFGKGAALNVEAIPRGAYEADIYRRIARYWYAACDEHRGDIIPGHITISLRINKQGRLENMLLISRKGASVSQQSFTFAAIRRAALPPMPLTVQQDIVGELLELIFTFHFD